MARVTPIELNNSERESLQPIIKKGSDWRDRDRAETILLLSFGCLVMVKLWRSANGFWFFGFFMALVERATKLMVVILENASVPQGKGTGTVLGTPEG